MASLSFAESQPPVNDEEEHPSLQEDEIIDTATKAFEPKERHRTTTHTGGGRSAEALNNPESFEHNHVFMVYEEGVDVRKLSKKSAEKLEKKLFGKRGNAHPNPFSPEQKKFSAEQYDKFIQLFVKKAVAGNSDTKALYKTLLLRVIGVTQGNQINFMERITTRATREEKEKLFHFLVNLSFQARFLATKIEQSAAEEFQRDFYNHLIYLSKNEPLTGLKDTKAELKALEDRKKRVEAKYQQDEQSQEERKRKRRKLSSGETKTLGLQDAYNEEMKYFEELERPLRKRIADVEDKIKMYTAKRPKKVIYGVKDLPENCEKDIALYAVADPVSGRPFTVELCRRENGIEGLRKNDYLPEKLRSNKDGKVHWNRLKSFPYDGSKQKSIKFKKLDNGQILERTLNERRAKALQLAHAYMQSEGFEDSAEWDEIYELPGMHKPTEDVSSVTSSQFRMARAGYGSNSATSSVDGGSSSSTTTTTTTTTTQKKSSP